METENNLIESEIAATPSAVPPADENQRSDTDSPGPDKAAEPSAASPADPGDKAPAEELSDERFAAMLEDAERRGYMRGRNERIENLMARPSVFGRRESDRSPAAASDEIMILNNLRPSVWE